MSSDRNWKSCFSPFVDRNRNAIERMFCRLKDFRRIATYGQMQFIEAHEEREARREELKLKKQADGSEEIDWDVEREETYQRLLKAAAEIVQLPAPTISE